VEQTVKTYETIFLAGIYVECCSKESVEKRRRNAKKGVAKKRVDKIMEERLRILNPELVSEQ
jgi:hypothetical protein